MHITSYSDLNQCTMRTLYSIFSSQPNEVGHDFTLHNCDIIQHIFFPTPSIARKTLSWTFLWASNSKFVIFPELYPCINYRILAFYAPIPVQIHGNSIIPLYHIQGNFEYRGILLYNVRIVHCQMKQRMVLPKRRASVHQTGGQCVTKPKIWTKPNPKLFSDTNFFRYRIRYFCDTILRNRYQYFFRYQNFSKPIPILFSKPIFSETDTNTNYNTIFFQYRSSSLS